jgi:Collagen triple helix repeat (20 copies)
MRLMRPRIRSWPTYANIATLAVVVTTSGGTLAATHYLITSTSQISPKVLKALKGKTGPAGETGPQGEAGSTGSTGEAGETGKEGPEGKEGSPWTAGGTLPSGKTETGTWAFVSHAEGPVRVPLSFSIPTDEPLQSTLGRGPVEFIQPHEEDLLVAHPNCPGSVAKPEADLGFICIYSATLEDPLSGQGPVRTSGVVLIFESTSTSAKTDEGTWAITAP